MNDRELLEMAAKAAGVILVWSQDRSICFLDKPWPGCCNCDGPWNPLHDDGDALRLAVKVPNLDLKWIIAAAWQACNTEEERNAYVRRAITCAAAEIGKAMP